MKSKIYETKVLNTHLDMSLKILAYVGILTISAIIENDLTIDKRYMLK